MTDKEIKKTIKVRLISIVLLALMLFFLMLFAGHPWIIESYYAKGLYPYICRSLHAVFNLFPFSAGDILYIAIILRAGYVLIGLLRLAIAKKWRWLLPAF